MSASEAWYLVRTKSNKELFVREQLSQIAPQVFLPMLKQYSSYRGNPSVMPLFPQYIFARLHLAKHYFDIRYLPGVTGFVPAGREPLGKCPTKSSIASAPGAQTALSSCVRSHFEAATACA